MYKAGTFLLCFLLWEASSLPDGAPIDACVKPRTNQPYHGQARSQPLKTNPYQLIASSDVYGPGQEITVVIRGSSTFKGFLIQARDVNTNDWIGKWSETQNTTIHPECSAITHADPMPKQHAVLLWQAPHDSQGRVYFTGTILKEYSEYWSDLVNTVAPQGTNF